MIKSTEGNEEEILKNNFDGSEELVKAEKLNSCNFKFYSDSLRRFNKRNP